MEPTDLNSSSATPDELEQRLLASAGPTLADDGFSQRVLAALPAPRRPWFQTWVVPAAGAAAGFALALSQGASATSIGSAANHLGSALADPSLLSAIAITAVGFALLQILDDGLLA